jgi:hypothetical protein
MIDYAQLKSERTEYLTAMATFLQSAGSMVQAVPEAMPMMLEFMKFGMVGFKGSDYMEGILDQAIDQAKKQPPKGQDDGKGQQDAQLEQVRIQGELQKIQAKSQADMQLATTKHQQEMEKLAFETQKNLQEVGADSQADIRKILEDLKADLQVIAAKRGADMDVEQAQSTYAIAETQQTSNADMTLAATEHQYRMDEIEKQADETEEKPMGND